jgi:uncharacterized RDD family membrane protein YckC
MTGPGPESAPSPQPRPPAGSTAPTIPNASATWSQITSTQPVAGPAGLYYADVPNRIIAQVIDAIIVGIVSLIVFAVLASIFGAPTTVTTVADPNSILGVRFETHTNFASLLINTLIGAAISAGYYIYTWTAMRGTLGQRLLGMQVGNATDGATITMEQGARRWLAVGGAFTLAQALNPLPGLGLLIGLASLIWVIALLVTTAQSPTKQGLHDRFANTVVVKAARAVS